MGTQSTWGENAVLFLYHYCMFGCSTRVGSSFQTPNDQLIGNTEKKNDRLAKILVSALANADPDKVNQVKAMVQALIDAGEAERQSLTQTRDDRQADFDTASGNLDTASDDHTTVAGELSNARDELERLQNLKADQGDALGEAQGVYDNAVGALDQAESFLSDETTRINSEAATLLEIRQLLTGLLGEGYENMVYAGHSCGAQVKNLGEFASAHECSAVVAGDDECAANVFMWSWSYPVWGCRCCVSLDAPTVHWRWSVYSI